MNRERRIGVERDGSPVSHPLPGFRFVSLGLHRVLAVINPSPTRACDAKTPLPAVASWLVFPLRYRLRRLLRYRNAKVNYTMERGKNRILERSYASSRLSDDDF